MNWIMFIFGSGLAFFLGLGCLLAGVALSISHLRWCAIISTISALLGLILILLSATPMPKWFYATLILLVVVWLVATRILSQAWPRFRSAAGLPLAVCLVAGGILELQYQFQPAVAPAKARRLYLFGDSLAAGIDENIQANWPQLISKAHHVELFNFARAGERTAQAFRTASEAQLGEGLVLLEIGGNDVLGSTTSGEYARDLEGLLGTVCGTGRQVVMFELPLPPFYNAYGEAQRRLAAQYHVLLIPKRTLIGVLAECGATSDSIHLTPQGHRQLADAVWQVIGPAYER